ncbi:MAG: hemerythrin domain-containing protein [Burkholderiales bacterium]|nr:hemerythrin domain-containing protein [Burkholderiales bacterium]
MNSLLTQLSPSITRMIRMDHSHVMTVFHRYKPDLAPQTKEALVGTVSLALEIHAQLEEEIFYPALRAATNNDTVLAKSVPEHDEMRRLIAELRDMSPEDEAYDETFMSLMREVIHHVADEETTLLPEAERVLADQLSELGAQMTRRRMELAAPRAGEIATNTVRAMPTTTLLMAAGGMLAGGYLLKRAFGEKRI